MPTEIAMTCPTCRATVLGGARFCMHCGDAVAGHGRRSSQMSPAASELLDQLIEATAGEYQILAELGRGGMAAVFLAEDLALGRRVAIKVMTPGSSDADGMADRFLLEARTAAQLAHPHIIPIYAVRTVGQLRYFVMKYVPGRSLDRALADSGPLPVPVVQAVLAQVGAALEHAHHRGVVHRDIKPANILLDEDGSAIVADFGIAKVAQGVSLTHTGSTVGTPTYMSPEQCAGKAVTGASDQYALGCVAFELIAGRPPFVHAEVMPVLLAHVSDLPPPLLALRPECPIELAAVIDKMLAKHPEDRWPSLSEAIESADAAPQAASAAVRSRMRALAGIDQSESVRPLPRPPVSPVPAPRPLASPVPVPVGRVRLTAPSGVWQVGERRLLAAAVVDQAGSVLPGRTVQWSTLDPGVAIVAPDGVVHARGPGTTRIRATAEGQSAEVVIEVEGASGELQITPGEGALAVGQVVRLVAAFRDARGGVRPASDAVWSSSDPTVLRVSPEGELTAFRPGQARIKVSSSGRAIELGYQVTRVDVSQVRIGPRVATLGAGEEIRLVAEATDRLGATLQNRIVTWVSSRPEVASVSPDGQVRGIGPGTARISATIGAGVAWMELRVTPVSISAVRLDPSALVLKVGESAAVRADLRTLRGGLVDGVQIEWQSSDPGIAMVSGDGVVTGLRFGIARIAASAGGRRATIPVEVRAASAVSSPRVTLGAT